MDNLTHSLIGAALGQAGLKRRTGLAMPALIIAANIPDIDAVSVIYGVESLAMRRGITHGPIAMVVLPLLLTGGLWWFDKWQARRGKRPEGRAPVHFGWLLALCVIGCLSHPLFDWFNNYGVRLLEPFSSRWFYGDTLFIIDPCILAMLGAGIWFSLRREKAQGPLPAKPALAALLCVMAFVGINMYISHTAIARTGQIFAAESVDHGSQLGLSVANAVPIGFWRRDVLLRFQTAHHGEYEAQVYFDAFDPSSFKPHRMVSNDGEVLLVTSGSPTNMSDPRIALWAKDNPAAQAFLFWSRMPIAELHEDRIILRDQRFMDPRTERQFSVTLTPPR